MKNKPKNFIEAKKKYEGEEYETGKHGKVRVIEYRSATDIVVQFENTEYVTITSTGNLRKGFIKDKSVPSVRGFGIVGDVSIRDEQGIIEKEYRKWEFMLDRVYGRPKKSYLECTVSAKFQRYIDFKTWCNIQIGFDQDGWVLDKDILVKGNKIYSPETCCFVPSEINAIFIRQQYIRGKHPIGVWFDKQSGTYQADLCVGRKQRKRLGCFDTPEEAFYAYKQAKESYIKSLAEKWKDQIDPRVYEALLRYEVSIDD